jgi:hypothetical protein
MLIYANSFSLNPEGGVADIIQQIATWIGSTRKSYVDPVRLGDGIRELRFSDGAFLSSLATSDDQGNPIFPYFLVQSSPMGSREFRDVGG